MPTDDFNRANGSLGSNWDFIFGDQQAEIVSNRVRSVTGTSTPRYIGAQPATADYSVQLLFPAGSDGGGPLLRGFTGTQLYYFLYLNGTVLELYKRNINFTLIGSYAGPVSTPCTLKIEAIGTTIKGYVDGVQRISVTDSLISAAGRGGIYMDFPDTFDDWQGNYGAPAFHPERLALQPLSGLI